MAKSIVRAETRLSKLGVRVLRNRRTGTFQLIDENCGGPVKRCRFDFERGAMWIDDLYGWTADDVVELARCSTPTFARRSVRIYATRSPVGRS